MDNGTNLDNWGEPKQNAWKWLLKEYGFMFVFWTCLLTFTCFHTTLEWFMVLIFLLLFAGPIAILIYAPKWYKELVDGNYILPFSRSSIRDIFK